MLQIRGTPVFLAAMWRHNAILKLLMAAGADVNAADQVSRDQICRVE
jgi:ankyrin repeat protein